MAKNKTDFTARDVNDFINSFVDNENRRQESFRLIELMSELTGEKPQMYGSSIIGFGIYHYKYPSGHQGSAPVIAFSPRKSNFTFYIYSDTPKSQLIIEKLGKFKMTKACIYVKKIEDIDLDILKELCIESIKYISEHNECSCHNTYK